MKLKTNLKLIIPVLLLLACQQTPSPVNDHQTKKIEFNQELADELEEMVVIDQFIAGNAYPTEKYSDLSQEEWLVFRDSIFKSNQTRVAEIFEEHGFAGYDLIGKDGSKNFWLIVQHSDHNPEFQNEVLVKMKIEVDKGNADSKIYGLLVDRVKINSGERQIYGTQVTFNTDIGQAYPKPLADSATVNERRVSLGLDPLEVYLNNMTKMHFKMNRERYLGIGITEPRLYPVPQEVSK